MDMSGDLEEESVFHSQDRFPIFKNHLPCSTRERGLGRGFNPTKKAKIERKKRGSFNHQEPTFHSKQKPRKTNGWFTIPSLEVDGFSMIFPSFLRGWVPWLEYGEPLAVFIFLPGVNLEDGILPSLGPK